MVADKEGYKKCSAKGCRKKATEGDKCLVHAKKTPLHSASGESQKPKHREAKFSKDHVPLGGKGAVSTSGVGLPAGENSALPKKKKRPEEPVPVVTSLEKKISGFGLVHKAKEAKSVTKPSKTFSKEPGKAVSPNKKSFLKTVSFEVGAISKRISHLLKCKKK